MTRFTSNLAKIFALRGTFIIDSKSIDSQERSDKYRKIINAILLEENYILIIFESVTILFDISSGNILWELICPAQYSNISNDFSLLALSKEQNIYIWDLPSGKLLNVIEQLDRNTIFGPITFNRDGDILAISDNKGKIVLWQIMDKTIINELIYHKSWIGEISYNADNTLLLSCSYDTTVCLWEVTSAKLIWTIQPKKIDVICDGEVESVVFHPDGKLFASALYHGPISLWNVSNGKFVRNLERNMAKVLKVIFTPDGEFLVSNLKDGEIGFWSVKTGSLVKVLTQHETSLLTLSFNSNGNLLICVGQNQTIYVWQMDSNSIIYRKSFTT